MTIFFVLSDRNSRGRLEFNYKRRLISWLCSLFFLPSIISIYQQPPVFQSNTHSNILQSSGFLPNFKMQLSALILSVMASLAMAVPTNTGGGGGGDGGGGDGGGDSGSYSPCTSTLLNAQPQCCSADVGNIADLTCATGKTFHGLA